MHILVIAFTILDGSENPNSPGGNHIIALLNSQEKYKYLPETVKDIASDIKSIKSLTIDGQKKTEPIEDGARTIQEIKCLALVKNKDLKYGCIHQPLFPSIPINHIIPDVLHLFLRISDILIIF